MTGFDAVWASLQGRHDRAFVQERGELQHVYDLVKAANCHSYLEIGTAQGDSLLAMADALQPKSLIAWVDLDEEAIRPYRDAASRECANRYGHEVIGISGDSTNLKTVAHVHDLGRQFDVVLIDAAHDELSVLKDALNYGRFARKFIFFHDVMLTPVNNAFTWYAKNVATGRISKCIHSDNYGYGIIEVTK